MAWWCQQNLPVICRPSVIRVAIILKPVHFFQMLFLDWPGPYTRFFFFFFFEKKFSFPIVPLFTKWTLWTKKMLKYYSLHLPQILVPINFSKFFWSFAQWLSRRYSIEFLKFCIFIFYLFFSFSLTCDTIYIDTQISPNFQTIFYFSKLCFFNLNEYFSFSLTWDPVGAKNHNAASRHVKFLQPNFLARSWH